MGGKLLLEQDAKLDAPFNEARIVLGQACHLRLSSGSLVCHGHFLASNPLGCPRCVRPVAWACVCSITAGDPYNVEVFGVRHDEGDVMYDA